MLHDAAGSFSGEKSRNCVNWCHCNLWLPIWVGPAPQVDNPFNNLWSVPRLVTSASIPDFNHSSHALSDPLSHEKWPSLTTLKEKKISLQTWFLNFSVLKYYFYFVSVFHEGGKNTSLSQTASPSAHLTLCLSCDFVGKRVCMKGRKGSGVRGIFPAVYPPSCSWSVLDTGFHTDIHFFGVRESHQFCCTNLTLFLLLSPDNPFLLLESEDEEKGYHPYSWCLLQSVLIEAMGPSLLFSRGPRILTFKSQEGTLSLAIPPLSAFTSETQVYRKMRFFKKFCMCFG